MIINTDKNKKWGRKYTKWLDTWLIGKKQPIKKANYCMNCSIKYTTRLCCCHDTRSKCSDSHYNDSPVEGDALVVYLDFCNHTWAHAKVVMAVHYTNTTVQVAVVVVVVVIAWVWRQGWSKYKSLVFEYEYCKFPRIWIQIWIKVTVSPQIRIWTLYKIIHDYVLYNVEYS